MTMVDTVWEGIRIVKIYPTDCFRRRHLKIAWIPFFYGNQIWFNLKIIPDKNIIEVEHRVFAWRLEKSGSHKLVGHGEIDIVLNPKENYEHKFHSDIIWEPARYELKINVSKEKEKRIKYKNVGVVTVKDAYEFGLHLFWISISTIIGFILGAITLAIWGEF